MNDCNTPQNEEEFLKYYQFRWLMLRKAWQQPLGSEKDSLESQSIHRMIIENNQVIAVGRLHKTSQHQAQIRYMAVAENKQGQGLGQRIIIALEQEASKQGVTEISLNARESAIPFYLHLGYQIKEFSHLLYNEIPHYSMIKVIACLPSHLSDLSTQLQNTWHTTIPLSKAMNIEICHYDKNILITHCDDLFNQNLHHTMFAGSIYTLATLTGWGWVYLQMHHDNHQGSIVLSEANIRYLLPIKGPAYAITSFEQMNGELGGLAEGRKSRFTAIVNIICGDKVAAIFTGSYVILPR